MKLLLLTFALYAGLIDAATITATSCSVANVQKAINASANGDTVIIPNGSCAWKTGIATSKQITMQGATVGGTTITHRARTGTLLNVTIGSSNRTTLANLRFMPGNGTGDYIVVQGEGLPPLMHNMYFNIPHFQLVHAVKWFVTGGVIWNATFESTENLSGACGTRVGSESGSLVVKPQKSWDDASTMGMLDVNGDQNLYIEDSIFSNVGQAPDVDDGGRVVVRNTRFVGSNGTSHGTTSNYGGRHVELYDNSFEYPNQSRNLGRYFWIRAGTAVITGNAFGEIGGQCYGNKDSEITVAVENAQRESGHNCCTGYMCFHQPGSGSDGTTGHANLHASQTPPSGYQISDPVYMWGNTGGGQNLAFNEGQPHDCTAINPATGQGWKTADLFVAGRDYFFNAGPKPGWSRYTYPHPLRAPTATLKSSTRN